MMNLFVEIDAIRNDLSMPNMSNVYCCIKYSKLFLFRHLLLLLGD